MHEISLPLDSTAATLSRVGGKGTNLASLARAGFNVPGGLLLTVAAYRAFVGTSGLEAIIERELAAIDQEDPAALDQAAGAIRAAFSAAQLPPELALSLKEAYAALAGQPLAIRSSATAEDLPEMSFAGQQDTFLNVIGEAAFLRAVVDCWSSLWTARAIGYRRRNAIDHEDVALAVVVQAMVPAAASGVLFSANPLTGKRGEIVIDATLGLGEALVGGLVEPDNYVVDLNEGEILSRRLGSKAVQLSGAPAGGLQHKEEAAGQIQALPDEQILALARLGRQIEALYDFPQDIEWAYADGQLYILQARPITSLFPQPAGLSATPLKLLMSFGAVQGVLGPMTPLGQEAIRLIFAGGAELFGHHVDHRRLGVLYGAGERLWADITPVLRHPAGARLIPRLLQFVDPAALAVIKVVMAEGDLGAGQGRWRLSTVWRLLRAFLPLWARLLGYLRRPDGASARVEAQAAAEIERLKRSGAGGADPLARAIQQLGIIRGGFPWAIPNIAIGAVGGILPLALLSRISIRLTGSAATALEITRGLPHNVTTAMDLDLWRVAQAIQADPEARERLSAGSADELAAAYLAGALPAGAQTAITNFMAEYGMRGPGEIDLGQPRWREEPTPILQILQSYIQIEPGEMAPDAVFKRGEATAAAAIERLAGAARARPGGWPREKVVRFLAKRLRALAGLRESPKYHIVCRFDIVRGSLLTAGAALVEADRLAEADDLFYLQIAELEALALGNLTNVKELVAERRAVHAREARRSQVPRLLLSDGRVFYEAGGQAAAGPGDLSGSPVSAGVVEGLVRVIFDPRQADLQPGEIIVCPGTDPAWTPLFLAAGGLVMEVGGLMTHGAIVAREYGIPAVAGLHDATGRLHTGQRIRLDGGSGVVTILE